MSEAFRPTSSADAHAESMADETLLVKPSSDPPNPYDYRTFQSHPTILNKPESSSTVAKTSGNVNQPVGQSSSNKFTSSKLFNVSELKTWRFYQELICEFIGTMLLVIVCTSTGLPVATKPVPDLNGALASGLIVATVVVGFGYISGAHINPAVTVTFLVVAEVDFIRAFFYIIVQLFGATSGSAIVRLITPGEARRNLGMTLVTPGVSLIQAFIVEFLITFILCYTVHAICDKNRDDVGGSKALAVGFAVTIGCLFGGPYTGASMNPSRSFGPAVVMNNWNNHWIYWVGPLTGSITAALIYKKVLKRSEPVHVRNGSRIALNRSDI
jgi:MIP family channel proteins